MGTVADNPTPCSVDPPKSIENEVAMNTNPDRLEGVCPDGKSRCICYLFIYFSFGLILLYHRIPCSKS